jgi:CRISPR system Cascade subunit CasE
VIYLSCLELELGRREARRWLSNPYRIHQRLLMAWPDGTAGRVLYRTEAEARRPRILVQSTTAADWERAFAGYRVLAGEPRQKGVELVLRRGQTLRFLLRANPTVRRLQHEGAEAVETPRPGKLTGERVGLLKEEEQLAWLERKAAEAGAEVVAAEARDQSEQVSYRASTRTRMVHQCVEFEGRLWVREPERLEQAVRAGIGPGKAFGFGLLSLAPAR